MHPMTQFSMGVMACQTNSHFVKQRANIHKTKIWEPFLEDALDVIAKVSRVASLVYHNCYTDVFFHNLICIQVKEIPEREVGRDYADNLAH